MNSTSQSNNKNSIFQSLGLYSIAILLVFSFTYSVLCASDDSSISDTEQQLLTIIDSLERELQKGRTPCPPPPPPTHCPVCPKCPTTSGKPTPAQKGTSNKVDRPARRW